MTEKGCSLCSRVRLNVALPDPRCVMTPLAQDDLPQDTQKDSPGADKESNWLPAPAAKFILMLRMYWPNESDPSILDGTWAIPPAKKV